ncbi:MAG: hypothetical protein AAF492_01540, partial [Verrucomicrobiota bacterium]
ASFLRNQTPGTFHPDDPDRLLDEMTSYSTRVWYFDTDDGIWKFKESLREELVPMYKTDQPRVNPVVDENVVPGIAIAAFEERSVAATAWKLLIPTVNSGNGLVILDIDQLEDIEIAFYHYTVNRP